ncbi:MAG: hypothetical protein RRZ24_01980 [Clostridia bacterium]
MTAVKMHDVTAAAKLIREDDEVAYGGSGYLGNQKRSEVLDDTRLPTIDFRINRRPHSSDKAIDWGRLIELSKSSVRWKTEHTPIIKCQFGCMKTRYRCFIKMSLVLCHVHVCKSLCTGDGRAKSREVS